MAAVMGTDAAEWRADHRGWFVRREGALFALARRVPVRWDVEARAVMPDVGRRRLAHAVRQDLWRAFQRVRGFSPAVDATRTEGGVVLRAGGQVAGVVPPDMAAGIAAMLADPVRRAAWIRAAAHRGAQGGGCETTPSVAGSSSLTKTQTGRTSI